MDCWQGSRKHQSGQFFTTALQFVFHRYSCFYEIWPFFETNPWVFPPFLSLLVKPDCMRFMPWGVSKNFPQFDEVMLRNLWVALPLEVFWTKIEPNSWSCFVLCFLRGIFEKIVKYGYISVYLWVKKNPLWLIQSLQLIFKKFHVWILMASLLPKVLKDFHPFTLWRCLDFTQISSR